MLSFEWKEFNSESDKIRQHDYYRILTSSYSKNKAMLFKAASLPAKLSYLLNFTVCAVFPLSYTDCGCQQHKCISLLSKHQTEKCI